MTNRANKAHERRALKRHCNQLAHTAAQTYGRHLAAQLLAEAVERLEAGESVASIEAAFSERFESSAADRLHQQLIDRLERSNSLHARRDRTNGER